MNACRRLIDQMTPVRPAAWIPWGLHSDGVTAPGRRRVSRGGYPDRVRWPAGTAFVRGIAYENDVEIHHDGLGTCRIAHITCHCGGIRSTPATVLLVHRRAGQRSP